MNKYMVTVGFTLGTSVEPDGLLRGIEDADGVTEYENQSSFYGESVSVDGGQVSFEIEAENEEIARSLAESIMADASYSDDSLEWEIEGFDIIDIEALTPPMDKDTATNILRNFINSAEGLTDEQRAAFLFLLDLLCP